MIQKSISGKNLRSDCEVKNRSIFAPKMWQMKRNE